MYTHRYIHTYLTKCKFLHLGTNNNIHWYILVDTHLESNLNMSQKCALVAKKVNGTLGCVCQTCCQQVGEGDHSPLLSPGKTKAGYCVQFWVPWNNTHMELLERVQLEGQKCV